MTCRSSSGVMVALHGCLPESSRRRPSERPPERGRAQPSAGADRPHTDRPASGSALKPLSFSWWPTIRETPDGSPTGTHEGRGTAMKMTIEPVSAFSSLDVLVAMDEALFSAEGLDLTMASRESRDIRSTTEGTLSSPVTNQGRLHERGDASMFQG